MGIDCHVRIVDLNRLTEGPISPHVDAFKQHLAEGRYASSTVASYLANIFHFARWVQSKGLQLCQIDEVTVTDFLDHHLSHCRCVRPVRLNRADHSAALGHLLGVLRARGAIAPATMNVAPVDSELRSYDAHMENVRGLAPKTRSQILRVVGRFETGLTQSVRGCSSGDVRSTLGPVVDSEMLAAPEMTALGVTA